MNVPYLLRLFCVCLASFFLLHLAFALAGRLLAPWILAKARKVAAFDSAGAARLLLGFRLAPAFLAAATVAWLCMPSFLSLESERGAESAGLPFLLAACLGGALWALSLWRTARALLRSRRALECRRLWTSGAEPVWLWDGPAPFLGLAGVFRPRVVISRRVAETLAPEQLTAALRHERAHRESFDNFKRLLLLLTPEALPGVRLQKPVDSSWARYTEWAADDRAVGHDAARSISLAEALVRVARLGAAFAPSPLVSPFVPCSDDIRTRVERLLVSPPRTQKTARTWPAMAAIALTPLAAALAAPNCLSSVHTLLETLMH